MKQTISFYGFEKAFIDHGRGNSFSYDGLKALFEHLEECGGDDMELDVVEIDCEFCEYESAVKCVEDCGYTDLTGDDDEDKEAEAISYLRDHTSLIKFDGGIIIQNF